MIKLVITGGHHNAGLVVAKIFQAKGISVNWIGHRFASRGDTHESAEYTEVAAAGIPFHDLPAGRLSVNFSELLRLPLGIFRGFRLLTQLKPSAILSFGGYLGAAVALAGKLLNLPLYLHEQTVVAGKANKLVAKLARRIYLTWPASAKFFPPTKSLVVGLPLRDAVLSGKKLQLFPRSLPTILVMGGKQGSQGLNHFIFAHLPDLLTRFNLIHQTGTSSATGDYARALAAKEGLGQLGASYLPVGYLGENDIGHYFRTADLYFGRSGAHVTYELAILGLPCVLVPFMHTHLHEQLQNARYLASAGLGIILPQSELSLPRFFAAVQALSQQKPLSLALPRGAGDLIVKDLLKDFHATDR